MLSTDRSNNFDAIRLVAAATVIVGHAWPLTGAAGPPRVGGIAIFHLAVFVFFSLSGYLVGTSWIRDPRPRPFLLRRASRIFPALVVVVILTVFVVGPLATTLTPGEYFGSPTTWGYWQATYELPGVFTELPRPVVNGSLWTLGPEFTCYLGVLVVGVAVRLLPDRFRARGAGAALVLLAVLLAAVSLVPGAVPDSVRPITEAMTFFAGGAAIAQAQLTRLPARPAVVLGAIWVFGAWLTDLPGIVWCWIALPYLVVAIGSRSAPIVRRAGRWGDLSYGMYLWGFPIQQLVVLFAPGLPLPLDVAIVLIATAGIAIASWRLVEAPALRFGRLHAGRPASRPLRATRPPARTARLEGRRGSSSDPRTR